MRHLTTWPIGNIFNLHNEMGRVFRCYSDSRETDTNVDNTAWTPTVDISETERGYEIRVELPGVTENDMNVSVTDNLLTIQGEKRQTAGTENKNYRHIERRYGSFQRSFRLPRTVETADIQAGYKDGVLTLNIPKAEEAKPTEIAISTD